LALLVRSAAQTETARHSDEFLRGDSPTFSLGNATKCPIPGATLEISLGSETVATLDRGALNVLPTRIARQGRNVHLTLVVLLLLRISAMLTMTVLEVSHLGYAPTTNVSAVHVVMTGTVLEARNVPAKSVAIHVVMTESAVLGRNVRATSA